MKAFTVTLTGKNLSRGLKKARRVHFAGSGNPLASTERLQWTATSRGLFDLFGLRGEQRIEGVQVWVGDDLIDGGPLGAGPVKLHPLDEFAIPAGELEFYLA